MLRLTAAAVEQARPPAAQSHARRTAESGGAAEFVAWLAHAACACPTTSGPSTPRAPGRISSTTCPTGHAAVFVAGTGEDENDELAGTRKRMRPSAISAGASSSSGHGADWATIVGPLPECVRLTVTKVTTVTTTELPAFEVGALVQARGREWVVLPAVRTAQTSSCCARWAAATTRSPGCSPPLSRSARRPSRPPTPATWATARQRRAAAHRAADRVPGQRRAVPLAGQARCGAPRLPARAAADGAAAGHGPAADRRRRRHRQDHRGRPDRRRAAGPGRGDRPGGAVPPGLAEQWQRELADEVRHRRRAGAALHDPQAGTRAAARRVAVRPVPAHRRVHRLHQVAPGCGTVLAWLPGPGDRRRGAHLRDRRHRRQVPACPLRAASRGLAEDPTGT